MGIVAFDVEFDGTDMSIDEIKQEARRRGWPGVRMSFDDFKKRGKIIVKRMSLSDLEWPK